MEQSKFYQIKNITEHEYTLVDCGGSVITRPIQDVDKSSSAFTIKDAKDGDVLAVEGRRPFIFKDFSDISRTIVAYCGINGFDKFEISTCNQWWTSCKVCPATKKQRNTLMTAMAGAGYTFDFDKKVLKKIEQNLAWSEEDEKMCQETIDWFEKKCFPYALESENPARESIKWLKSLKDKSTWKPSYEQLRALHDLTLIGNISYAGQGQALIELYNDLKRLNA